VPVGPLAGATANTTPCTPAADAVACDVIVTRTDAGAATPAIAFVHTGRLPAWTAPAPGPASGAELSGPELAGPELSGVELAGAELAGLGVAALALTAGMATVAEPAGGQVVAGGRHGVIARTFAAVPCTTDTGTGAGFATDGTVLAGAGAAAASAAGAAGTRPARTAITGAITATPSIAPRRRPRHHRGPTRRRGEPDPVNAVSSLRIGAALQ
jgi:hypothetical protein